MIDADRYAALKREIAGRMEADRHLLDSLRSQIRLLQGQVRRIQPRTATAISLVATDGGNNRIQFDPFMVQLVRVVDSSNNEYCLFWTSRSHRERNTTCGPADLMLVSKPYCG